MALNSSSFISNINTPQISPWAHLFDGPPQNTQGPQPVLPGLFNSTDASGNLDPQYQLHGQPAVGGNMAGYQAEYNGQPLQNLEGYASNTGDSPWAQVALGKETLDENKAQGDASQQADAALGSGYSSIAAHGGATAGARERLAMLNQQGLMNSKQNVGFQGAQARAGIRSQDEQQKFGAMEALPGMEQQKANSWANVANADTQTNLANRQYQTGVDQANIGNAIGGIQNANQNALNIYGQQMAAYGSAGVADAMKNAKGSGKGKGK